MKGLLHNLPVLYGLILPVGRVYGFPFLEARQSAGGGLPAGWITTGCYSDTPAARTLRIASFTSVDNMTIEACLAFCTTPTVYNFAGVEFSRECYCDDVIESPGSVIDPSECNIPCTGDSTEICGGSGAINIFQNTAIPPPPPPASIKKTVGTFQYAGCFDDGVNGAPRSLAHQITISGGATAETCTAACKAAGFVLAGLEFGGECWCDSYMPWAVSEPDSQCNSICDADDTELCGAGNRLAVYQDTSAAPLSLQQCLSTSQLHTGLQFNFQMVPATGGGSPVLLGAVFQGFFGPGPPFERAIFELGGETQPNGGPPEAHIFTLQGNTIVPDDPSNANFTLFGSLPVQPTPGESQIFEPDIDTPGFFGYCALPNPVSPFGTFIGPPVLSVSGSATVWASCAESPLIPIFSPTSANGQCSPVFIEMTPPLVGV